MVKGEVLKSGWIRIYSGGRAARADGMDVGGEKKKRFKPLGLEQLDG